MVSDAILQTLSYSDIFHYPLTREQVWRFLISKKVVKRKEVDEEIEKLLKEKKIVEEDFISLVGREGIQRLRTLRKRESEKKYKVISKYLPYLKKIPTVVFIGVSGGLALDNANGSDDIDLFIISRKNTMWLTRFLVLIILQVCGLRRKRFQQEAKNTFCANMFMDEGFLSLPLSIRDIYTAHEVIQVKPVYDKKNYHHDFLLANGWILTFLPHAFAKGKETKKKDVSLPKVLSMLEYSAKLIQTRYMKKHRTTEIITSSLLMFHPIDYRTRVLKAFQKYAKV